MYLEGLHLTIMRKMYCKTQIKSLINWTSSQYCQVQRYKINFLKETEIKIVKVKVIEEQS